MKTYNATLYFDTKQNALDAGYCDAVESDLEDGGYMSVITFECDDVVITLGESLHHQLDELRAFADANNP